MATIAEAFGQNLRKIRVEKGWSQDRLALRAGIDRSYMGRVERGEVNITIVKVYQIAEVLGVPARELIP